MLLQRYGQYTIEIKDYKPFSTVDKIMYYYVIRKNCRIVKEDPTSSFLLTTSKLCAKAACAYLDGVDASVHRIDQHGMLRRIVNVKYRSRNPKRFYSIRHPAGFAYWMEKNEMALVRCHKRRPKMRKEINNG